MELLFHLVYLIQMYISTISLLLNVNMFEVDQKIPFLTISSQVIIILAVVCQTTTSEIGYFIIYRLSSSFPIRKIDFSTVK